MGTSVYFNVQVMRAAAAGLVAFFHLQVMLIAIHDFEGVHFPAIGVDIFFVISGFVMFISNPDMDKNAVPFFLLRLVRIVPLYWLATGVVVAFFLLGFRPNGLMALDAETLVKSLFFIQSEFENGRHDLILSIGWTLIYELFFYVVLALTFFMRSRVASFLGVSLVFAGCVGLGALFPELPRGVAYFTNPIILEFLFGAALALLVQAGRAQGVLLGRWAAGMSVACIILACGIVLACERLAPGVPGAGRVIIWGLPSLMIVAGLVGLEYAGYALKSRMALLLGAASYALYLFHPVIMQGVVKLFVWFTPVSGAAGTAGVALAALAAAAIGSILIHLTVETPILEAGRRFVRGIDTLLARARFGT